VRVACEKVVCQQVVCEKVGNSAVCELRGYGGREIV
jgi:hypothetical protein